MTYDLVSFYTFVLFDFAVRIRFQIETEDI